MKFIFLVSHWFFLILITLFVDFLFFYSSQPFFYKTDESTGAVYAKSYNPPESKCVQLTDGIYNVFSTYGEQKKITDFSYFSSTLYFWIVYRSSLLSSSVLDLVVNYSEEVFGDFWIIGDVYVPEIKEPTSMFIAVLDFPHQAWKISCKKTPKMSWYTVKNKGLVSIQKMTDQNFGGQINLELSHPFVLLDILFPKAKKIFYSIHNGKYNYDIDSNENVIRLECLEGERACQLKEVAAIQNGHLNSDTDQTSLLFWNKYRQIEVDKYLKCNFINEIKKNKFFSQNNAVLQDEQLKIASGYCHTNETANDLFEFRERGRKFMTIQGL